MARTGTDHRGWNRQWRRAKKGIIIINHHHQHHHHRVKASSLGGKNFRVWKWTSKTTKRLVDRAANEPKAGCFSNFINFFCTLGLISSGSFCTISLVFCFACLFFFRFHLNGLKTTMSAGDRHFQGFLTENSKANVAHATPPC